MLLLGGSLGSMVDTLLIQKMRREKPRGSDVAKARGWRGMWPVSDLGLVALRTPGACAEYWPSCSLAVCSVQVTNFSSLWLLIYKCGHNSPRLIGWKTRNTGTRTALHAGHITILL